MADPHPAKTHGKAGPAQIEDKYIFINRRHDVIQACHGISCLSEQVHKGGSCVCTVLLLLWYLQCTKHAQTRSEGGVQDEEGFEAPERYDPDRITLQR